MSFPEVHFLCQIREVLLHYFFQISFQFFLLFLFSFWYLYNSDVGMFKIVTEVPKPLLIFLNSCFFILFWFNVYFFLLVQIIDLSAGFLPFTVGSLYILIISLWVAFICSFILWLSPISSVSILITSVLNFASDRLAISLLLSSFSGVLICSFIWAIFLCLITPVWMNVSSLTPWLSDFHAVWFSGSSDCFLFLNLLLSFFWLCEEVKHFYVSLHLDQN